MGNYIKSFQLYQLPINCSDQVTMYCVLYNMLYYIPISLALVCMVLRFFCCMHVAALVLHRAEGASPLLLRMIFGYYGQGVCVSWNPQALQRPPVSQYVEWAVFGTRIRWWHHKEVDPKASLIDTKIMASGFTKIPANIRLSQRVESAVVAVEDGPRQCCLWTRTSEQGRPGQAVSVPAAEL